MSEPAVLRLYRKLGPWLFARAICFKAPYFSTIRPRFLVLEPGRCVATLRHRLAVTNHLGTVHAIALCNLAELTAGLMAEATLPPELRWIPKGMAVDYRRKAVGTMCAEAVPAAMPAGAEEGEDWPVDVRVTDPAGETVMQARITLWVTPRPARAP